MPTRSSFKTIQTPLPASKPFRFMVRVIFATILLCCLPICSFARAQSTPGQQTQPAAAKPTVKKSAAKDKAASKQSTAAESGSCQIGVISAIGGKFAVRKVGFTVFGNELTEVPIPAWGLDDLVVARVRAAASGVRKIAYPAGAFETYDRPARRLGNGDEELTAIVRQTAANSNCARYFVFTTYTGQLQGTNQSLPGIGVLQHGSGPLGNTSLFANVAVKVFDGQSFAIAKGPSIDFGSILAGSFGRLGQDALTKLDAEDFPASPADAPASSTLRDRTRALLAARLDKAVAAYLKQE
jgi:hypothetical protein